MLMTFMNSLFPSLLLPIGLQAERPSMVSLYVCSFVYFPARPTVFYLINVTKYKA